MSTGGRNHDRIGVMKMLHRSKGLGLGLAFVLVLAACGGSNNGAVEVSNEPNVTTESNTVAPATDTVAPATTEQYVVNASEEVTVELGEMYFSPKDFALEAGKPYILKIVNVGAVKHEFTAGGFFQTVATRKAETAQIEVKVPFFTEIEVFAGETVDLYLIPLVPGTYDLKCEIEGHFEAGMFGTITVTGTTPASPAPQFADVASGPWVQDGPALVKAADWKAAEKVTIELGEMYFAPKDFSLVAGKPYIVTVVNVGAVKHEFTADEFFGSIAFRKAEDASGEFKAPAPREVEVFSGKQVELFLIPTKAGIFDLKCEIEGHFEAGMFGTITVTPAT
ncbi:MAG: plastocyanin/azurin family copper-binding protein [Ilumatobacteraceae bacterium]